MATWKEINRASNTNERYARRVASHTRRERGGAFGQELAVGTGTASNHARERAVCQVCGQTELLVEHEGQMVCQTCLEGLAEAGAEVYLGGQWEIVSCYGVTHTVNTEEEARAYCEYAASRGIERTYRRVRTYRRAE